MAVAKCGNAACVGSGQFEVESMEVGSVTASFTTHRLKFTLFKCAACGVVLGVVEGTMVDIARRQGLKV